MTARAGGLETKEINNGLYLAKQKSTAMSAIGIYYLPQVVNPKGNYK